MPWKEESRREGFWSLVVREEEVRVEAMDAIDERDRDREEMIRLIWVLGFVIDRSEEGWVGI